MWVLYGLLGLIALIVIVLSIPICGRITYDGNGELYTHFHMLGVPVTGLPLFDLNLFRPSHNGRKTSGKLKEQTIAKLEEMVELMKQDDVAGTMYFFCEVAKLAAKTVGRILRSVKVKQMDLQMLIASEDPADTAQQYGQVCSLLYPALAGIEHLVRIRRRNLRVEPNFLLERSNVCFDLRLRISWWRLLYALLALSWGILMIEDEQNNPQITKEVS